MKKEELQNCCICGHGILHCGVPIFYRIKLDHMVVNPRSVQQTHGLEQFFGGGVQGAALASVMGTDPDIAEEMTSSVKLICHTCFLDPKMAMGRLIGDGE